MQATESYSLAVLLNEEERLASHDVSDAHPVGVPVALRLNLTKTGAETRPHIRDGSPCA
jgi:hypothetical protein